MSCKDGAAEVIDSMNDTNVAAPDFNLASIDAGDVKLEDFAGKPLVIFFFGSTCPRCKGSAPKIETNINSVYADSQIGLIGIDTWNGNLAAVEGFRATTNTSFNLLLNGSSVQSDYMTTYDRLFVIDKDGIIVHAGTTAAGSDISNVTSAIDKLLE